MSQHQHVIAEWLLKLFARDEPGGLTLSVFDKATGTTGRDVPSRFSAILDDHSGTVEVGLGRIESAAAEPVRRLVARAAAVQPGLWPLAGATDNLAGTGDMIEVPSPDPEMRLFHMDRWLAEPPAEDRAHIARYLTLMFTRSPKMERAIADVSSAVRAGFVQMVKSEAPGMLSQTVGALEAYLDEARFVGLRTPDHLTHAFAAMDWYVVRAAEDAPFVLGDSPVVSTIQIGHDQDSWRPLLSPETFAVCMPLATLVCLVVAPQKLMPVGIESPEETADAVNRLSWRWADRYIVGSADDALTRVHYAMPASMATGTIPMDVEPEKAFGRGLLTAWKVLEAERTKAYGCIKCWPRYAQILRPPSL
jgi:Protein of unknown function (DUF4238)